MIYLYHVSCQLWRSYTNHCHLNQRILLDHYMEQEEPDFILDCCMLRKWMFVMIAKVFWHIAGDLHPPNRSGGLGSRGTPPGGASIVPGGGLGSMGPAPPHGAQLHQFRGVTPPYVSTWVVFSVYVMEFKDAQMVWKMLLRLWLQLCTLRWQSDICCGLV